MTGRLVVVGTPIGNLQDMSRRAERALREASVILCEDTRRTRKLLSALAIPAPRLARLDRHTEAGQVAPTVELIRAGAVVALVSDAGMPTISDPGAVLVKGVTGAGLPAEVVPGPCAVSAALALSGLPASEFRFVGFLPRKGRERRQALAAVAAEPTTVVIYESPHRVAVTVADLAEACGADRELAAVRELTKLHEEVWRTSLGPAAERLRDAATEPKGEWVLVLGPRPVTGPRPVEPGEIERALQEQMAAGVDRRTAIAVVAAELGVSKRAAYDAALTVKGGG
ncbi:MAG: 16S rRNA (cytidine(1402)-2'-O)-methyltransferase [Actinomycetota bacterium]|nr:16S rRNA (cytidine(1402)-2'-O)-methyltransferase [Actinomycetota bacterium]